MENKKENIRITRCYLVEYIDKDGKQIDSDFCFGTKEDAKKLGNQLKDNYKKNKSYLYNISKGVIQWHTSTTTQKQSN